MSTPSDLSLEKLRRAIVRSFPELADGRFEVLAPGWHSVAVAVDDRLVFKFPRSEAAEKALIREARLLARIRPAITMTVPDLTLHPGPPLFTRHGKIAGHHLTAAQYAGLSAPTRQRLAGKMAVFYAELHRLDADDMAAAGALPIEAWRSPDEILVKAVPILPPALQPCAERIVAAFEDLPPDPHGMTFGFFDGHGWNMAFDHAKGDLTGIYDFADSGFGPLHQEFIYTNFISPDLTARIVSDYEAVTGRSLDRERIDVLTGVHRLSELADLADDPEHAPAMIGHVVDWASHAG